MKNKKIFIDTDMGSDDIMAICMLLLEKTVEIVGISTVNGVSTGSSGYKNIRDILAFLQYKIAVEKGYTKALIEKNAQFPQRDIERANNLVLLEKLKIPSIAPIHNNISIEKFIYTRTASPQKITILALGPLTNIAATITKYGEKFCNNLERIILMGGGIKKGNVPPNNVAEYNIFLDPEAAGIVFQSKIPIVMIGIDATSRVKATNAFTEIIKKINPEKDEAKIIKEVIINNDNDFDAFYDPLAAYIVMNEAIITKKLCCNISVSLSGRTRGKTTISNRKYKNVTVVTEIKEELFYNYLLDIISEK